MGSLTTITKQALGLAPLEPTRLDVKLLSGTTDYLGRTAPLVSWQGNEAPKWLDTEGAAARARSGYTNHDIAYSVITRILEVVATVPWGVYKVEKDDSITRLKTGHPLIDLLYRPNPRHSWSDIVTNDAGNLLISGNAFVQGVRPAFGSRAGKVNELWPMPTGIRVKGGGYVEPVTGYELDKASGGKETWEPNQILHFKYWNPTDTRYGLSPVQAGARVLTAAVAGQDSRVRQYQNQGPPGVLFDKSATDVWTDSQLGSFRRFLRSFFGGGRNRGEIPVLGGELGYLNLGLSPVDLDILAAMPHDKDAICDLFGFPGELMNGSKGSTFANRSEASKALYKSCIIPLLTRLRDGYNRFLGPDYDDGVYIDFDLSNVPELQESKAEMVAMLAAAWWIPVRRRQQLMGEDATWDGPEYVVPAGLMGYEQLGAAEETLG